MPTARSSVCATVVDNKIYVIGGTTGDLTNVNEMYDTKTNIWATKQSMPTARCTFGVAVWNSKVYCIGGLVAGGQVSDANEVYDPATDSWTKLTPIPTPKYTCANVVNGKIYLISGSGETNSNDVYDIATNSWTTKTPIPNPVVDYASAVLDDKIYIISQDALQIYDTITDSWNNGAATPTVLCASAAATSGTYAPKGIYVIGVDYTGRITMETLNLVYNPQTNTWSNCTSMLTSRDTVGLVVVNDLLYAIGGKDIDTVIAPPNPSKFATNERYIPLGYSGPSLKNPPLTSSPTASEDNPSAVSTSTLTGGSSENPSLPMTALVAGVAVACTVIAVTGVVVYRFKHAPIKASQA
ncbi:MAG: hypothetical protein NWF01_04085 [Candidatus Bathyarchaeota archaeon]|nr:hypothetical protein [Candidatus Bathyarchaeota archaeon]